jgi:hypothetical protein
MSSLFITQKKNIKLDYFLAITSAEELPAISEEKSGKTA